MIQLKWSSLVIVCITILFATTLSANPNLQDYIQQQTKVSDELFVQNFPFADWIKTSQDYAQTKRALENAQRPSKAFFLFLGETMMQAIPATSAKLEQLDQLLALGTFASEHSDKEFEITMDMAFSHLTQILNTGLETGTLDKNDENIQTMIDVLKQHQYGVTVPVSDTEKGIHHLKNGNWEYLFNRIWLDYPLIVILGVLIGFGIIYKITKKLKKHTA